MAHSVELLFDADSEAAIVAIWQALDAAGLPCQLRVKSDTNRPHVTLLAAQRISADVDGALRELAAELPLSCAVGAAVVFTGPRMTLARLVVPSAELLTLHERVYRLCLPHLTGEPFAHCRPGHWTAHATLGRRYTATDIGAAFELDAVGLGSDLPARLVGLRRWDGDNRVDHLLVSPAD